MRLEQTLQESVQVSRFLVVILIQLMVMMQTVSAGTITSGVYSPGTIAATQDTAGAAFTFSQSYTQATMY